jgi:ElaB/YqjD/DUF883 family membrane-anchored ribosome-binding protein
MSEQDLVSAKRDAEAAKARLLGTAHELQERLTPKNLAETALDALRDKGQAAAQGAARAVRSRPMTAAAAAAGLVALIACKPIAALVGRYRNPHDSNGEDE